MCCCAIAELFGTYDDVCYRYAYYVGLATVFVSADGARCQKPAFLETGAILAELSEAQSAYNPSSCMCHNRTKLPLQRELRTMSKALLHRPFWGAVLNMYSKVSYNGGNMVDADMLAFGGNDLLHSKLTPRLRAVPRTHHASGELGLPMPPCCRPLQRFLRSRGPSLCTREACRLSTNPMPRIIQGSQSSAARVRRLLRLSYPCSS